jgi:hypothetical protein
MSRTRFRQRHFRSAEHITHRGKTQSFISGWTQHNERTRSADQMESGRRIVQTPDDLAGSTRAKHTQPESQAGAGDWSYLLPSMPCQALCFRSCTAHSHRVREAHRQRQKAAFFPTATARHGTHSTEKFSPVHGFMRTPCMHAPSIRGTVDWHRH